MYVQTVIAIRGLEAGPIYTWTNYELQWARELWKYHYGSRIGYRRLLDDMVDQCALVRDHYALPTTSYSIKEVAPLFGFKWRAQDAGGLVSVAWYEQWLEGQDPALLGKIMDYNLDDVRAMLAVVVGLVSLRARR